MKLTIATIYSGRDVVSGVWALVYITVVLATTALMAFGLWTVIREPEIASDTAIFGMVLLLLAGLIPSSKLEPERAFRLRDYPLSATLLASRTITLLLLAAMLLLKYVS